MREFNYKNEYKKLLSTDIVSLLTAIHEYKGKQYQITSENADTLSKLVEIAKIQSTDASNKIEGISTSNERLQKIVRSKLPQQIRWQTIRTREFIRRRSLRRLENQEDSADAFIFHGYSFSPEPYRLILEVYSDGLSQYRKSLFINQGENLIILNQNELNGACWKPGNIVKVYPENNYEAELDILWCDFVKGHPIAQEKPAEKVKCVVWDLDNTLWDGTLIETENAKDLIISETVKNTIYRLDERGIIQSVASKNDFEQAWPVVEASGLSEYFIYPQINWGAKSNSMTEIAHNLNIGLDTFALIDDSPFERNEVWNRCPQIRVYEPCELNVLLDKPEFDVPITNESRRRRLLYKAEEKRNFDKAVNNAGTIEFLESCHLETKVFIPETDEEILRCFELLSRTNQLNMSGKKYSEAEFDLLLKDPNRSSYAFSCKDDYGEYGIVGFLQYHVSEGMLIIDEFAMSCRVAGKYVESSLFTYLLHKENCEKGCITVIKTTKNGLLRKTLEGIGFRRNTEAEHIICYSFSDDLDEAKLVDTGVRIK